MATAHQSRGNDTKRLEDWKARINLVVDQVKKWSGAKHWHVEMETTNLREDRFGDYVVPSARVILSPTRGEIHVEPVALDVVGGDGRIDVWAYPTMNRVRLVGDKNKQWVVYTDSNVTLDSKWSAPLWYRLVNELLDLP